MENIYEFVVTTEEIRHIGLVRARNTTEAIVLLGAKIKSEIADIHINKVRFDADGVIMIYGELL